MSNSSLKSEESQKIFLGGEVSIDKQALALDALSNLARQFSDYPDFNKIIQVFLLTTLGQFAATNAFILFIKSKLPISHMPYFANGAFSKNNLLESLSLENEHSQYFLENRSPQRVADMQLPDHLANFKFILSECGVKLIAPMVNNSNLIGIVGLGGKVNKKQFDNSDIEILSTILNTVTPFVANTFLFSEMTELGKWYLSILNNVKQGVFVFNQDGRLKKINNAGFEIIRAFKPQIENNAALHRAPMELIFPDSIFAGWINLIKRGNAYAQERLYENLRAADKNGERIYNVRTSSVKENISEGSDLIITLDDITDQKISEQRLFNLEKLADKGMMVASITHELNNFLGLMMGGVELAQMSLDKNNSSKANDTLVKVSTAMEQMKRFTTGLTDLAKMEIAKKSENLNKIISDVLSFVSVQKKFGNINVLTDLDPAAPEIEIDVDQISQVLLNLLNNAADSINAKKPNPGLINVLTKFENERIHLIISDNGQGIPEDLREKMFKYHFTTKPDGHGFGLVTCGKILHNHKTEIKIDSTPGKGAEFNLAFPIS